MINPIDLRKGMVIKVDGDLYTVTFSQFVNPGKGSAFVRTKIKNIKKGNVLERTFKSSEKIEDVELDKRSMSYLYREGEHLVMMDKNDYEQFNIPVALLEDILDFIKEEMVFDVFFYENQPVSVSPPTFVELQITYAEEGIKGDTVGTAWKKVQVETGGEILVPIHIRQGDIIKIDLRDLSFVERVNK
jgi:elongation factor P